jgi:DNA-binding IclR family transcriptional regulator
MNYLQRHPPTTATTVASDTDMSFHTAQEMLVALQPRGIVTESTGRKQGRFQTYTDHLDIVNQSTTAKMR